MTVTIQTFVNGIEIEKVPTDKLQEALDEIEVISEQHRLDEREVLVPWARLMSVKLALHAELTDRDKDHFVKQSKSAGAFE